MKKNGSALEYASERLQADKDVVLAAVKQYGDSIVYANWDSDVLYDREIILAAVKQDGDLLRYASEDLKNDKELVLTAVKQYSFSIHYVGDWLRHEYDVLVAGVISAYGKSPRTGHLFLQKFTEYTFKCEVRDTMSLARVNKHCYMNAKNENRLTLLTEEGLRYFLIHGFAEQFNKLTL